MTDIVERLLDPTPPHHGKCLEAAAEIRRLREQCEALEQAVARVRQAISYAPKEDLTAREQAIAVDLGAGLSLRQIAAKHGVGVGVVRGVKARAYRASEKG